MKALSLLLLAVLPSVTPSTHDEAAPKARRPQTEEPSAERSTRRFLHGIVEPSDNAMLGAPIDGVLARIHVREGDRVRAGQVVAVLDDRVARASVAAAQLAASRTSELRHAQGELELARKTHARIVAAYERGAATPAQVDESESRLAQAQAGLASAEETQSQAERNLELEKARLEQHLIRSPLDGWVTRVLAQRGETVPTATELLRVVDLGRLRTELHLPLELYDALEVGERYPLRASAPVSRTIQGRMVFRDPLLDPATRTFRAVFEIENADEKLPAGFTVELLFAP